MTFRRVVLLDLLLWLGLVTSQSSNHQGYLLDYLDRPAYSLDSKAGSDSFAFLNANSNNNEVQLTSDEQIYDRETVSLSQQIPEHSDQNELHNAQRVVSSEFEPRREIITTDGGTSAGFQQVLVRDVTTTRNQYKNARHISQPSRQMELTKRRTGYSGTLNSAVRKAGSNLKPRAAEMSFKLMSTAGRVTSNLPSRFPKLQDSEKSVQKSSRGVTYWSRPVDIDKTPQPSSESRNLQNYRQPLAGVHQGVTSRNQVRTAPPYSKTSLTVPSPQGYGRQTTGLKYSRSTESSRNDDTAASFSAEYGSPGVPVSSKSKKRSFSSSYGSVAVPLSSGRQQVSSLATRVYPSTSSSLKTGQRRPYTRNIQRPRSTRKSTPNVRNFRPTYRNTVTPSPNVFLTSTYGPVSAGHLQGSGRRSSSTSFDRQGASSGVLYARDDGEATERGARTRGYEYKYREGHTFEQPRTLYRYSVQEPIWGYPA